MSTRKIEAVGIINIQPNTYVATNFQFEVHQNSCQERILHHVMSAPAHAVIHDRRSKIDNRSCRVPLIPWNEGGPLFVVEHTTRAAAP